jgi:hypothetical protein
MALSGQTTVTTAGTEVVLGSQQIGAPLMVKALTTNTGLVYVGESAGALSSSTGMPLAAGEVVIFEFVGQLGALWVDSAVNGEGVAWLALSS